MVDSVHYSVHVSMNGQLCVSYFIHYDLGVRGLLAPSYGKANPMNCPSQTPRPTTLTWFAPGLSAKEKFKPDSFWVIFQVHDAAINIWEMMMGGTFHRAVRDAKSAGLRSSKLVEVFWLGKIHGLIEFNGFVMDFNGYLMDV